MSEADNQFIYLSIKISRLPLMLPTLAIAPSVRVWLDKVTMVV